MVTIACVVAATSAVWAQSEQSATVTYRGKQGDTLELVAAEFYGDATGAAWIAAENKLQHPRPLRPGERIKVPVPRDVVTAKGDSFESLAATYLGDARRASFLAELNGMSIDDATRLPVGVTLRVPIQIAHTSTVPESLANISTQYFGDAKQVELIRKYNYLEKSSIDKGESVLVPLLNVKVRENRMPPLDTDAKARRDHRQKVIELVTAALPRAHAAWAMGDFAEVRASLSRVADEVDYLDATSAIDVALLLGRADIAFDDTDHAVAELAQVLDRRPRYTLNAYAESPKVIAAWKKAGGHVDGE